MNIRAWLIASFLWTILLFMLSGYSYGQKKTDYRPPTPQELIDTMRVEVLQSLAEAMIKTTNLARIEMAMQIPCAKVWVSTKTIQGHIFHGIEANLEGCKEEAK